MFKKAFGLVSNKKGAALIWMLIVFTVTMIIMTSIIYVTRQDIKETVNLEERLQTYYIAATGIDLTYAALMDPSHSPKKIEAAITKLKTVGTTSLKDTIDVKNSGKVKGTAKVTITRIVIDEENWIQIVSVGKLINKNTEVTTTMKINEANTNQIVRQKFEE